MRMVRIFDPAQLTHPRLHEFAVVAAGTRGVIATLAESANDLEDLLIDVPPEDRVLPDYRTPRTWDIDSFVVALSVVQLPAALSAAQLRSRLVARLRNDAANAFAVPADGIAVTLLLTAPRPPPLSDRQACPGGRDPGPLRGDQGLY